jgi:hypothetical protein
MNYPREFFEINLRFAWKVSEITQKPIKSALLHYTNLYIRLGIGRDFDAENPTWQEYLDGLCQAEDTTEWTYHFYLKRQNQVLPKSHDSPFGCFSYSIVEANRIRLHFHNNEPSECSPLAHEQMGKRLSELKSLFVHIKHNINNPVSVIGASWLYNLEAYRRLFPPTYLITAQVSGNDFPYLPLWGQFIDHYGRIKESMVARFLECLDKQHRLEDIEKCFPFPALHLESSIWEFYQFYGV